MSRNIPQEDTATFPEAEAQPDSDHNSSPRSNPKPEDKYASFIKSPEDPGSPGNEIDALGDLEQLLSRKERTINSYQDAKDIVLLAESQMKEFQQKEIRKVIQKLDDILERKPQELETLYQKGCALLILDMYEEAKKCLEQAHDLVPEIERETGQTLSSLQYNISCVLGECYLKTENNDQAREIFSKLKMSSPKNYKAFFGLGMCYSASGDFVKALEEFEEASTLNPTNTEIPIKIARCLKCIGDSFLKQKKFEEAIGYYTKAIEINKENVAFYCKRGAAHFLDNNKIASYIDFERAAQLYKTKMPDVVLAKDNTEEEARFIEMIITEHVRMG